MEADLACKLTSASVYGGKLCRGRSRTESGNAIDLELVAEGSQVCRMAAGWSDTPEGAQARVASAAGTIKLLETLGTEG